MSVPKTFSDLPVISELGANDTLTVVTSSGLKRISMQGILGAIKIGGRNLMKQTKSYNGKANDGEYKGFGVYSSASSWEHPNMPLTEPIVAGETYTMSYYVKGGAHVVMPNEIIVDSGDDWERKTVTFKAKMDSAFARVVKGVNQSVGVTLSVCGIKLERGNVATDWTPAPEDSANSGGVKYCTFCARERKGGARYEYARKGDDQRCAQRDSDGRACGPRKLRELGFYGHVAGSLHHASAKFRHFPVRSRRKRQIRIADSVSEAIRLRLANPLGGGRQYRDKSLQRRYVGCLESSFPLLARKEAVA